LRFRRSSLVTLETETTLTDQAPERPIGAAARAPAKAVAARWPGRAAVWLDKAVVGLAFAYPAALVVIALLLRFVGERWWVTGVTLYLPRIAFGAPLPFLAVALVLLRRTRLLVTQAVAALIVVFPLMGFVLPMPSFSGPKGPTVRVLSYNVNSGYGGFDNLFAEVEGFSPDIIFFQELTLEHERVKARLSERYANVQTSTQFLVASRFPILSTMDPDKLPFEERQRSPRFLQHVIDTPLGPITFYNVHPISPRHGFYKLRAKGLSKELLSGRLFTSADSSELQSINGLRELQVQSYAELAGRETGPVVIAGDMNLTGLSPVLARHLSRYHDAFTDAGWGFGYTFPTNHRPWMRLDRILATDDLAFSRFEVGTSAASDHRCVVADFGRR
jgi:endonuclease/exonuclease/phosphatase family metal-dependent hydrolase